ncbi:MAG: VWA domain-containing protein [Candidatus Aminicenantes bacterium]|nr:VWA domain-containing protein [Candidatus Aminicenantes bacterium]
MSKLSHKHSIFIFTVLFWAVLGQFSLHLFSQTKEKPLRYEVEVVLIEIPLYMIDKEGNPIKNLKPEEVILYENGIRQEITHFIMVQADSPEIASVVRKYPVARRQFLLLIDFAFATPARIVKARRACMDFIKEKILPNDLVAVATYSAMGGLEVHSHFTNDREHLFSMIDTLGLVEMPRMHGPLGFTFPDFAHESSDPMASQGGSGAMGEGEFQEALPRAKKMTERIYIAQVSDFIGDINRLSIALNAIKGRKHIIFFSEGFDSKVITGKSLNGLAVDAEAFAASRGVPSSDTDSRFGDTALRMKLYDALKRIASADCPIHTVDIGGLRTQAGEVGKFDGAARDLTSIRRGQDTLTVLSRETGGQVYKNINELDQPLENLLKITNTYYILGYYPEDKKKEGKYRDIKIKTTRPDVRISYRKGYYEAKPYSEYSNLEKKVQLVEYVVNDLPTNEIQFDSFVSAFRGREGICQVPVFLKFPGGQFLEKRKIRHLEIYGYAISSPGVFKDFFHQTITITISPNKFEKKLELAGLKYYDLHLVPPGDYRIRLIVRDADTGEIGSQTQEISVPDYEAGALAVSGPVFLQPDPDWIIIRGFDPEAPTGRKVGVNLPLEYPYVLNGEPFIPGVVPIIQEASPVQIYLRAYNLKLHPKTQVPQTEMSFEVVDMEGQSISLKNVRLLQKPTQVGPGVFDLLFRTNFGHLPRGPYLLKLFFKDALANQTIVTKALFVIR